MTDRNEVMLAQQDAGLIVRLADQEMQSAFKMAGARERNLESIRKKIYNLVMLDNRTAAESVFALPRGGRPLKGPSIRFAETICSQYGNCRVAARVVQIDKFEKFLEAEGIFHDLETNTMTSERVRRRIADSRGRLYNDDMITMTGNAACSIAKRNAILKGIPRPLWRPAYDAAEEVLAGDVKTLSTRRADALRMFFEFGVTSDQIFTALEIGGENEIGLDQISTLVAIYQSIKNGEETVESYFPKVPSTSEKSLGGETKNHVGGDVLEQIISEGKRGGKNTKNIE